MIKNLPLSLEWLINLNTMEQRELCDILLRRD
jgi:hypothetical protein